MICTVCHGKNPSGARYCSCGAYLRAKPGPAPMDMLQLSKSAFLDTVSEGLPLIFGNAMSLWDEAQEIASLGSRRAVGILQSTAEEEAAKILLLIDCLRCPPKHSEQFKKLLKGFDKHLAKGVYSSYYNVSPSDLLDVSRIVSTYCKEFYRDGEYGEYVYRNSITDWRERRLYVSYVRNDDGSYSWQSPYPPELIDGQPCASGVIAVSAAMNDLGMFEQSILSQVAAYWQNIPFEPVSPNSLSAGTCSNVSWCQLSAHNARMFEPGGITFQKVDQGAAAVLIDRWLFPLYPFDLESCGSISDLGAPELPDA